MYFWSAASLLRHILGLTQAQLFQALKVDGGFRNKGGGTPLQPREERFERKGLQENENAIEDSREDDEGGSNVNARILDLDMEKCLGSGSNRHQHHWPLRTEQKACCVRSRDREGLGRTCWALPESLVTRGIPHG